jgi:23S rRNA (guanosine2251-2'-O)-methyltransferase
VTEAEGSLVVYGRIPVLEALADEAVLVEQVLMSRRAKGDHVDDIVRAAGRRAVPLRWVAPEKVTRMSGNGRQDQGVVADVHAPALRELATGSVPTGGVLLVLDGVTNPANVGMIVRAAVAAGLDGIVLPRVGSPGVGPLVVKASAGVALRAPIFGADTAQVAVTLLRKEGWRVVGLDAGAGTSVFEAEWPDRVALALGSESEGLSGPVRDLCDELVRIPLGGGVESLNVAVAAGIACFEVSRRRVPRP